MNSSQISFFIDEERPTPVAFCQKFNYLSKKKALSEWHSALQACLAIRKDDLRLVELEQQYKKGHYAKAIDDYFKLSSSTRLLEKKRTSVDRTLTKKTGKAIRKRIDDLLPEENGNQEHSKKPRLTESNRNDDSSVLKLADSAINEGNHNLCSSSSVPSSNFNSEEGTNDEHLNVRELLTKKERRQTRYSWESIIDRIDCRSTSKDDQTNIQEVVGAYVEDDAIPEDDTPAAIKKYESDLEKAIKLCKRKNVGRANLEKVSSEFVLIVIDRALITTKIYPDVFRKVKREGYASNDDDCSVAEKRIYEEVRKFLSKLKFKEIATDSPMGSGILDLTNHGNKIAERLPQDVQEALTKHELKEGLKRVRPVNFPGIEDNIDQELEDALFVTHGLLEGLQVPSFERADYSENGYVVLAISKILDPIFACDEDETLAMHAWAKQVSQSSHERKENFRGENPDFKIMTNTKEEILFGEVKTKDSSLLVNKDLVKLSNFQAGALDELVKKYGNKIGLTSFGIWICGTRIRVYEMDLNYDGMYRMFLTANVMTPTEGAQFLNLIPVLEALYNVKDRIYEVLK
ncbi:10401_t:CDS:10, partial [Paraglomus brasilianum]